MSCTLNGVWFVANLLLCLHGAWGACLILHWNKFEISWLSELTVKTSDSWMERSWPLSDTLARRNGVGRPNPPQKRLLLDP